MDDRKGAFLIGRDAIFLKIVNRAMVDFDFRHAATAALHEDAGAALAGVEPSRELEIAHGDVKSSSPEAFRNEMPMRSGAHAAMPLFVPSTVRPEIETPCASATRSAVAMGAASKRLAALACMAEGMRMAPLSASISSGLLIFTCST